MLDQLLYVLKHVLSHTWMMIPILFIAYLVIIYVESKNNKKLKQRMEKGLSPIMGGFLGVIPQCGMSVAIADLFNRNKVSVGTLIAVFIATSDEAILILFSAGSDFSLIASLILIKLVLGISIGLLVDKIWKLRIKSVSGICMHTHHCECCKPIHKGVVYAAMIHTLKTFAYVFIVAVIVKGIIVLLGEDTFASILLSGNILQPFITGFVGFIPTCATSVVIAQLLVEGSISFGAAMSGLITNAGFGLIVLVRGYKDKKIVFQILAITYVVAVLVGVVLSII